MLKIEIQAQDAAHKKQYARVIKRAVRATLLAEGVAPRDKSVSVLLTNNDGIQQLNRDFRQKDTPTDVLSFPSGEEAFLGDIAISVERATAQAREIGQSVAREIAFLTVHSMLHLLGYDHMEESEERRMREHQRIAMQAIEMRGSIL